MQNITHRIGDLEVTQRVKDGYINATQLCKVYEIQTGIKKAPRHWFETDRANRLIELVSDVTGISVTQLFQGGNSTSYGTWIHPDLATPFASWLSVEYELLVSRWVQEWMKTGQNPIKNAPAAHREQSTSEEATLGEIFTLFASLNNLGIEPKLVESAKLTAVARSIPRLGIAAEEGKRLISSQMFLEEIPMSPTGLGVAITERLGLRELPSAQKVNQVLLDAGLQIRETSIDSQGNQKKTWILTEAGKKYGQLQMDTARRHNKTVFCLRWFSSVIPIIEKMFTPLPDAFSGGSQITLRQRKSTLAEQS